MVVLVKCLAEAESRVEDDVLLPIVAQPLHPVGKEQQCGTQVSLGSHQHIGHAQPADHAYHGCGVAVGVAHIVNDVGTQLLDGHTGHVGAEGIDAHHTLGPLAAHHGQCCTQPCHLLLFTDRHIAGPRGAGTDVGHCRTLGPQLAHPLSHLVGCLHTA